MSAKTARIRVCRGRTGTVVPGGEVEKRTTKRAALQIYFRGGKRISVRGQEERDS